jgi:hypothetical protein
MLTRRIRGRIIATLVAVAVAAAALALVGALAPASGQAASTSLSAVDRALLTSKELWATIDVCSPADQPNTLGVRGSMPGDGKPHDRMYMSFRVQYHDGSTKRWVNLASDANAPFVAVGGGGASRQDGTSFQITPVAGKPAFLLRGVVDFQWRRGRMVVLSVSRATSAGHRSLAGADPANFSAASCSLG